ncbi:MAG TPA: ABC transporter permease subunit [Gaiellaceae bacterium]
MGPYAHSRVRRAELPAAVTAFFGRRLLLAAGVLLTVSFGTFVLIATKFSTQCPSQFSPQGGYPPLAANAGQAATLYWRWLKSVPNGHGGSVCGGAIVQPIWAAFGHTAALLALTALLVVVLSLLFGTIAAVRAGSLLDAVLRGLSYIAWAVPSFLLALMLLSVVTWARERFGFHAFAQNGWPGYCPNTYNLLNQIDCPAAGSGLHYAVGVMRHITVPAIALALAFVGLHSRYLRSSLLVSLHAPFTTTRTRRASRRDASCFGMRYVTRSQRSRASCCSTSAHSSARRWRSTGSST